MSDAPNSSPPGARARHPPNYAARRMLVGTIAITVVVALAVVGWRMIRGDDDGGFGAPGEWDEIALIDRATGAVTVVDDEGEPARTIVGAGRVVDVHVRGDRLALVGPDQIALVDDGDDPVLVPIETGSDVTAIDTADTFHLAVGQSTGGNVLIVDAGTGDTIDIGALAEQPSPLMFAETLRFAADGSAFAVADAANFQTILARPDALAPSYFPDQPVAVGTDLIATSQVVGREADVTLYDMDRRSRAMATVGIPAGGVMIDGDLLVVSIDGSVFRLGRGDEEAEQLGTIAVPAGGTVRWVSPTLDGSRLVAFGDVFEAVVDLDGTTVFTTTFTAPVDAPRPRIGWRCLPVGGAGGYHSLITLDTGEQLADLTGLEVSGTASDGCTVIGERSGVTELVTPDGSVRLGRVRSAALGPDGRSVVVRSTTGETELRRLDDELELGEPVDLGAVAPASLAVAYLDR